MIRRNTVVMMWEQTPRIKERHLMCGGKLKLDSARSTGEGVESSSGVLEVESLGVGVLSGVHGLQMRILVQHVGFGLNTVITHKGARNTKPVLASLVHCTDFSLAVLLDLFGNVLGFASLNVQSSFENLDGSEWTYTRLISVNSSKEICIAILDEFLNFFHL